MIGTVQYAEMILAIRAAVGYSTVIKRNLVRRAEFYRRHMSNAAQA